MRLSFLNWLMRGFNDFTSEIDRQIDRQASIPPVAGLVLAVSAAAGGIYFFYLPRPSLAEPRSCNCVVCLVLFCLVICL